LLLTKWRGGAAPMNGAGEREGGWAEAGEVEAGWRPAFRSPRERCGVRLRSSRKFRKVRAAVEASGSKKGMPKSSEPSENHRAAPRPGPFKSAVFIVPSRMVKTPGKRLSHGSFATGQYCRPFDSMAATPGTCAAMLAE